MHRKFQETLNNLAAESNLRCIPTAYRQGMIDLTSNDYLGIATRTDWVDAFLNETHGTDRMLTSSASRLLAGVQSPYEKLERLLSDSYGGRSALLYNSGYHANTGIISALADSGTLIVADRLVHASIIDGIVLSKAPFVRFRHNDWNHLEQLLAKNARDYSTLLVIVEGVYSMDGDSADIEVLLSLKQRFDNVMLYVDEAHSFGVCGADGLGLTASSSAPDEVDIIVGTFGKAAASFGAFSITSEVIRQYLVNKARSLIFSTALPPISAAWTRFVVERIPLMTAEREHLAAMERRIASTLSQIKGTEVTPSHIIPYVVGDPAKTVSLAERLVAEGVKVLPIRTPTVPAGTERLRLSLSTAITTEQADKVCDILKRTL